MYIQLLIKTKIAQINKFLALSLSEIVFIMPINFKMPMPTNVVTLNVKAWVKQNVQNNVDNS